MNLPVIGLLLILALAIIYIILLAIVYIAIKDEVSKDKENSIHDLE